MSPFITKPFGIHSNCFLFSKKKLFDVLVDVMCALYIYTTPIVIQH